MARSTKKPSSKKSAKKVAPKKTVSHKAPAAKKKPKRAPKKVVKAAAKPKSAKASKPAARAIKSANGKAKAAGGKNNQAFTIVNNHAKGRERRLDPFTRTQKDKLLQLRDAMVDSMAGVAQDTLRARLEAIPFARFTVECQSQLEKQSKASRVRQSVTSLFGLTDDEAREGEEEEKTEDTKE